MASEILFEGTNSHSTKITLDNNDSFVELLNPIALLESKINIIKHFYYYDVSFKIEGFRLLISIESLNPAPFPNIFPEDSTAQRNQKMLETEYHNPNIIFRMFKQQSGKDYELGDIYCQNRQIQYNKSLMRPYLTDGNIPVKLWGYNNILKAKLIDSGSGLLKGIDYLETEIDYSYIVYGLDKINVNVVPNDYAVNIKTGTPQLLINANNKRVKLYFKNEGEGNISYAFGNPEKCVIGQSPELKPMQAFNDEGQYPFQQSIYAIAHSEPCLISVIEGTAQSI